jgi:4-amino-4-deoxy-L-arabinose transferase-like glycosyltransferase
MSGRAHAEPSPRASALRTSVAVVDAAPGLDPRIALGIAVGLAAVFVAIALPVLATLPQDFDEGWFMLDARFIARGGRPFIDFPHHEMPLHLYLLAAAGRVFGATIFGYRMLSLLSLAASGIVLFGLVRPFAGSTAALAAEAVFLFSPVHGRSLAAVPETPALCVLLVGALVLFTRESRRSAWAAGIAFAVAVLLKPQYLLVVAAAAAALAWARDRRRLVDLTAAGSIAGLLGAAWVVVASDGIVADTMRFQLTKIGTRTGGMWSIASGFDDMRRLLAIETPRQWAALGFRTFFRTRVEPTPVALFALGILAVPIWLLGCARGRPALRAFVVLWPASLLVLNFVLMEFVSPRYFIPFFGFTAFLVAGWVWLAERRLPSWAVAGAVGVACAALSLHFAATLGSDRNAWFWDRTQAVAREHPKLVSFNPIAFAATGTEPACGFANPALTYGSFGEHILATERLRRFQFNDERLIACLRADPELAVVVDWAFYFFTRPGSALRAYLAGEGSGQRVFFSPEAAQQWDRPLLQMSPLR